MIVRGLIGSAQSTAFSVPALMLSGRSRLMATSMTSKSGGSKVVALSTSCANRLVVRSSANNRQFLQHSDRQ
jgi:hypothetical protein